MNQSQQQNSSIHYFTLGNFQKDTATLVDSDYNLIQIPKSILPIGIQPGSIVKISISRDIQKQKCREKDIQNLDLKLAEGNYTCGNILREDQKKIEFIKQDKKQQLKNRRKLRSLSKKN